MLLQRVGNTGIRMESLFERAARRHPTNVVILDHTLDIAPDAGQQILMRDAARIVHLTAARLHAAGVGRGREVVIYKRHSFDITMLACAVNQIGATPVLLSPALDGDTAGQLIARLTEPFLVTDDEHVHAIPEGARPPADQIANLSPAARIGFSLLALDAPVTFRQLSSGPDEQTLVTHTSGTTGLPKLAVHTGRTLEARYRPQATATCMVDRRGAVLMHVSFVHSRTYTALAIAALRGHPILAVVDDSPENVAAQLLRWRPLIIEAHPNSFMRWESLAADPDRPLASVKYFSSTFDAIHPRTVQCMLRASGHRMPIFGQLYGQSEVGPVTGRVFLRSTARSAHRGSRRVGRAFPGMTAIRVVSRNNEPVRKSNPGHIEVRTDGRVLTYLGESDRYRDNEDDGWWRTGDLGFTTRLGGLYLLDREVDAIDGIDSTLEIEDKVLSRLPQVSELVIINKGDDRPLPVLSTAGNVPLDPDEWRTAVQDLAPMLKPWHLDEGDMPTTATTKVKRLELVERALSRKMS